ncbi:MAG: MerR family transcriptional regulator [Gracilimonas sp.]|uniref:MerR family transcriptional regulator n=1 Tax=Gracilimonas sp. TaxID=1974203 RepID=UPI0019ADAE38|nr:MerR family transcriptional regulator [Gracilimonas sp.]MBD3616327.1 MerR family transcriptional regulator [Gracilimonas sp.]
MKKLYYSMGEVSKLTGLEPHVLRNWEKTYSELSPKKNSAGNRVYKEQELALIFRIKELLHERKYSSEGVQEILSEGEKKAAPELSAEARKDLSEIKVFLNDLLERL